MKWRCADMGDSKAANGQLNVCHSLQIAHSSTEDIGLGQISIISALLHDIVNKTDITLGKVRDEFGETVAHLIEEYTKLSKLNTKRIEVNSVKFRNLFMTIVDDIRVILLKLAHRLHDMRTSTTFRKRSRNCSLQRPSMFTCQLHIGWAYIRLSRSWKTA